MTTFDYGFVAVALSTLLLICGIRFVVLMERIGSDELRTRRER